MNHLDGGSNTSVADSWRLECPVGHSGTSVQSRTDHWYCSRCAARNIHPAYSYVRDKQTGEFVEPGEVVFE
ncbi:hypothetical protein [Halorubrum laminariae]|uniref:Uncharacterized protein n=1 Tax=Halorubrum laminariae TaxID=1433523 RepID=A0ABD6C669_9EURY|nr:hypothetical protein [Halorubrum laminariae]